MERKTFCVVFFCKKTKVNKKGKAPIYVRITSWGQSTEIYTQCQTEPEKWNQKAERVLSRDKVSVQINEILSTYRVNILQAYDQLIKDGKEPNCFAIKQRLTDPRAGAKQFLTELALYCEKRQKEVPIRITQLTANKYHRMLRYLKEYTKAEYRKEDILLEQVSYEYIDGFKTFLQTAKNCKNNGAVNLLCCMKNFILYCLRNEWIEKNPFQYYKLKEEHNRAKDHLTKTELELLLDKPMPNARLERVRDAFCFSCFTGMAFTDAEHLRAEHISTDDNGMVWIRKPRQKTSVLSRIPLLPQPLKLLKKYENDTELTGTGKLIPVPSNQKMNAYLKEIAIICNIDKNLTTHVARHTFACLAVEYGMPIDILAKVLGHTNANMTRHYAKFSEGNISREMQKLGNQLR